MRSHSTRIGTFGLSYGLLGFAAGFLFGAFREMVLIPAFGGRAGHLIEFPLILIAITAIALWLVRRQPLPHTWWARHGAGAVGVLVLVASESSFALVVMQVPVATHLDGYDVTKGALFPIGLLWMGLAPSILSR